jgi:hypothetical protein
MQNGQLPILHQPPESRQHFDVWNFHPTISAWVSEKWTIAYFRTAGRLELAYHF